MKRMVFASYFTPSRTVIGIGKPFEPRSDPPMTTKPDTSSRLVLKVEEPIFEWGRHEDYIRRVEQAGLLPVAPLSSAVLQGLEAVGREDQYEGAPNTIMAAARLSDGSYLP